MTPTALNSNPPFVAEPETVPPPVTYRLEDLGEVDAGMPLLPVAINDAGDVAIYAHPPQRGRAWEIRGFLRRSGQLQPTGQSTGRPPLGALSSNGLCAGLGQDDSPHHARAWASHLGLFGAACWPEAESSALGVNRNGTVVGQVVIETQGRWHKLAFRHTPGSRPVYFQPPAGGSSIAVAVNDDEDILINESPGGLFDFDARAVLIRGGRRLPLGDLGGGVVAGTVLTPEGRVAGRAFSATGHLHAFLWVEGTMYDLNTDAHLESDALGANDSGTVVGGCLSARGGRHAFRWTPAEGMRFLGELVPDLHGWELRRAVAINAAGCIAGIGRREGNLRGFLLHPR